MPKGLKIAVFLSAVMVMFASCGSKSEQKQTAHMQSNANDESKELKLLFPQVIQRDEPSVGGTFIFGYANDTPWKSVFNTFLYEDTPTKEAMNPMLGQFTVGGSNHELRDGGYCSLSFDREKKTATYHIHPKVTWSDGVPVTAEDIIFVYECIGHPDYTGVRYDSDYENVVGMVEYHKGEAKTISGIKKIDDKTVEVTFKNFFPGILWGAGITYNAEPAHYLKDIPLAQMASHDRVRKTPLACGPFVINSMIEGDLIEYVPNPYWFGKKPGIDKLIVKRLTLTSVAAALKSGEIDAIDLPNSLYDQFVELDDEGRTALDENGKPKMKVDNIDIVGNVSRAYSYIGMKMGTWNKEKEVCEMFPDGGKFKDKALRHAIGYAMDNDGINDIYYHGLRITANSFITPYHPGFYDVNRKGYSYNPEKAKQLLDEAGYKDIDGDGYRETPDGKPLKINFLFMSGGDIAEPMSNYYIQNWKDVGLNVALNDGRLIEFNAFYDRLQEDDPTVELYSAAWGVGSNPDPNGFYNKKAQFNMSRQVSAKNDELLDRIASAEALDEAYRTQAYKEWDENFLEEATVIPTSYRMTLKAVNKRVTSWDERFVTDWDWCDIGLTSEKPIVNTMK
nr:oligopeptide ABC transporter substrate-binding protein [uncultured Treponema sp.]